MKIMVVDDDPDVVEAITLSFNIQWPESTIVAALDGRAALQKFDREHPDVVLLDIALPDTDGFEVCRLIRERSDVPILMISARGEAVAAGDVRGDGDPKTQRVNWRPGPKSSRRSQTIAPHPWTTSKHS